MSDTGTSFTCVNHPNLRWFNTKPGGRLIFAGELPTDEHPTGRPDFAGGIPPFKMFKARMEGVNPYNSDIKEDPSIKSWDDVISFVNWIKGVEAKWSFECECPSDDKTFVKVDDDANEYLSKIRLPDDN